MQARVDGWLLRMGTVGQLLAMLTRGGRWWMLPLVGVLMLAAVVLIALQSVQYVAPFIYLVF